MPLASFFYVTPLRVLKSLAGKVEWVLKNLVSYLVASDIGTDIKEDTGKEKTVYEKHVQNEKETSKGTRTLFPAVKIIDDSLDSSTGPVPCSMDFSRLQNPLSMVKTPEGHFEWRLTEGSVGLDESQHTSLDDSASPESSITPKSMDGDKGSVAPTESRKFVCHLCHAEFHMRGYLTRHLKKHAVEKAYRCPYHNSNLPKEQRCHRHGGFTRRDTFKTHLRSRHFVFPKGVKSKDRVKSFGVCLHCDTFFENTEDWIKNHVEAGECKGLPEGFKVTEKAARKSGKLKKITTADGQSRFISTDQTLVKPKLVDEKKAAGAAGGAMDTSGTPDTMDSVQPIKLTGNDERTSNIKYEDLVGDVVIPNGRSRYLDKISPGFSSGSSPLVVGQQPNAASSYAFNFFTPSKSTPLDEGYLSVDPSPTDDAGLETVKSSSSASSRVSFSETQEKTSGMQVNPRDDNADAYFQFPLDFDQCPMSFTIPESRQTELNCAHPAPIETTSQLCDRLYKQMEASALNEKNLRENQHYLNLYNHTFNAHL
ncbi:LAFA_0E13850g1_1 [Lachancea sp. 'fantastica']|nr:LAFA_0E13850g1_1 [Lachancea sp. 'fantastica']